MEDLIDSYVDREGAKKDTEFILGELNQVYASIKKVRDTKLTLGDDSGFRATVNAAKDAAKAIDDLTKAEDKLSRAKAMSDKQRILSLKAAQEEEKLDQQSIKTKKLKSQELERETRQQEKLALAKAKAAKDDPNNIPFTTNLDALRAEQEQLEKTGDTINDFNKTQAESDNAATAWGLSQKKAAEQAGIAAQEVSGAKLKYDDYTGSLQDNLETVTRNNVILKQNKSSQAELNLAIAEAGVVTDKQATKLAILKEEEILLQAENKKLTEITKLQSIEFTSASGSIDKARAQLELLRVSYDGLSKAEKAAPFGVALRKEITTTEKSLVKLEKQAGISARSATNVFTKAYGAVRQLANLIPGLGLAGVVLILLEPIKQLINAFASLFKSFDKGKIAVQALNEVNLKAIENYNKEKTVVTNLTAVINDNTISLKARKEALKELIALAPEYLEGLTLENLKTAEGKKLLDSYVDSLQRKGELQAAQEVGQGANKQVAELQAEKKALENLRAAGTVAYDDLSEAQRKFLDNTTSTGRINMTASIFNLDLPDSDVDQLLKNIDKAIDKANVKVKASTDIFKDKFQKNLEAAPPSKPIGILKNLNDQLDKLNKDRPNLTTVGAIKQNVEAAKKIQEEIDKLEGKQKKEKRVAVVTESTKAILDSNFELYRLAAERRKTLLDHQLQEEGENFDKRLELSQAYFDESVKLIKKNEEDERRSLDDKLKAQEANLKRVRGTARNNLIVEIQNTKTQIAILESKSLSERLDAELKLSDQVKEIYKDRTKFLEERYEQDLKDFAEFQERKAKIVKDKIEIDGSQREASATLQFEEDIAIASAGKREKVERNYQKRLADIRDSARLQVLIAEERALEEQKAITLAFGGDTIDVEKKITQNAIDQANLRIGITKREYTEKDRIRDEALDKVMLYETEALDLLSTLNEAENTKQKNAIQDQIDLNEKKKNEKIDAVNKELISDEEKANKIKVIEATAQAERERLEARQRKLDLERARFEKNLGIMKIILEIGIALAKQQYQAAALAGVALIKAIATPLPKFGKGKDKNNKYRGLAEIDEAGKREYVHRAKTNTIETSSGALRPRLTFLDRDDIVYPSMDAMLRSNKMPLLKTVKDNSNNSYQFGELIDAVNSINISTTEITKEGWKRQNRTINDYHNWWLQNVRN